MKKIFFLLLIAIEAYGCSTDTINSKASSGYLKRLGKVYYSPMGNSYDLGIDELPNADLETFTPISERYGKDAKHVYYTSNLINQADPVTFKVEKFDYATDKNRSYYSGVVLNGISSDGFFPLSGNYFRSAYNYYYKKSTFDGLKTVFVNSYQIPIARNHPLKIIDTNLNLSTDGISVFYFEFKLPLILESNFAVKKQGQADGPFFYNGKCIYFISDYNYPKAVKSSLNKMQSSLGIIASQNKTYYLFKYDGINEFNSNNEWAIVNNNALYCIKDKSLVFVAAIKKNSYLFSSWSGYAMGDDTVYYYDGNVNEFHQIIKIDNRQNDFKLLNDFYAKNNKNVYYQGKIIPKADGGTFKTLDVLNGFDKRYIYNKDRIVMNSTAENLKKFTKK